MRKLIIVAFLSVFTSSLYAQTANQNTGWFMFLNSTKFSEKWGMHFDLQVRSEHNWKRVKNVLVRPGITYYINKSSNATFGYLYTTNRAFVSQFPSGTVEPAIWGPILTTLTEHRIWQQYIYNHQPWKSATLSHRFRLEQRFIERQNDDLFSQRFRYFFRLVQPLQKQETAFTKGVFAALQNETFFNLQNKEKLNGSLFDQNRAYLAVGYRFSKKIDIEAGYLNQVIKGSTQSNINNAVQLAIYTRF